MVCLSLHIPFTSIILRYLLFCKAIMKQKECMRLLQYILLSVRSFFFFFFQAEDGIRDIGVTGVQTCALPICRPAGGKTLPPRVQRRRSRLHRRRDLLLPFDGRRARPPRLLVQRRARRFREIGRASCRERV